MRAAGEMPRKGVDWREKCHGSIWQVLEKYFLWKRSIIRCTVLPLRYFSNECECVSDTLEVNNDSVRGVWLLGGVPGRL